jgi:ADP-heptose:LPS heptosyltransferase
MLPENWSSVKRVLVIRLDNVGDMVMLGPALRTLRAALPEAHITLMATPAGTQVAPMLPWVDEVMTERVSWQDVSGTWPLDPALELTLVERVRAGRFDAALIFTSFSQSPYPPAFICYLAGIPVRLGQSKEFGGAMLSQWVRPLPDDTHQVDRNLHLLEAAGLEPAGRHLELCVPAEAQTAADALLRECEIDSETSFVVLAPGASAAARRYDPQRYAQVAGLLQAETGLPIVVVGSQREEEMVQTIVDRAQGKTTPGTESHLLQRESVGRRSGLRDEETAPAGHPSAYPPKAGLPAHTLRRTRPRLISLAGRTSVVELAAVIRRASLVIANDSGPMHMADAFERPMVVLFSGTEYESQWRPRRAPARLLRRPTDCSPCFAFRCPYHMECLDIPAAEVVQHALELLRQTAEQPMGVY